VASFVFFPSDLGEYLPYLLHSIYLLRAQGGAAPVSQKKSVSIEHTQLQWPYHGQIRRAE